MKIGMLAGLLIGGVVLGIFAPKTSTGVNPLCSGGSSGGGKQSLSIPLPNDVSLTMWAQSGALQAAKSLQESCAGDTSMVSSALDLAKDLLPNGGGKFVQWNGQIPSTLHKYDFFTQPDGTVSCTNFVADAFYNATGKALPYHPDAVQWWAAYSSATAKQMGFLEVPAGQPGNGPLPGDIVVLDDGALGHVAVIVGVQPPQNGQDGFILVTQGNSTTALETWAIDQSWNMHPPWAYWTHILGYIRYLPASVNDLHVVPITQLHASEQYDTPQQFMDWAGSVCSDAAFAEVLRYWGVSSMTIGQALDRQLAHNPPYIDQQQGLLNQAAWQWMATAFRFQAQVNGTGGFGPALSYDTILSIVASGKPVIIGIHGLNTRGVKWGHFLVVVGGNSTQLDIVDSSTWYIHHFPRSGFSGSINGPDIGIPDSPQVWATGETVVLTPAA